jgi:murein DD-endopeptidase MepM/ murein hydrolase activator NlpD
MREKLLIVLFCGSAVLGPVRAQQVFVDRDELAARSAQPKKELAPTPKTASEAAGRKVIRKIQAVEMGAAKTKTPVAARQVKDRSVALILSPPPSLQPGSIKAAKAAEAHSARAVPSPRKMRLTRVAPPAPEPSHRLPFQQRQDNVREINVPMETAPVRLADGFDFPVGKPDAQGYYKARGFRSHGHLGEDWDGLRGGDTDLGDPIYSIGNGIVVFARDCHMGWGNVVIVRHVYRESGQLRTIDSLYGHLDRILVRRGQQVNRGQQIGTMGTAHGLYDAHLHLEIRKNIEIGMSRAAFARDFSNYCDPSQFISSHRHLRGGGSYRVAMNTFIRDSNINFDGARNYSHSHSGGGTRESAAALRRAMAAKNTGVVNR